MTKRRVGVLGATSFVGESLLPSLALAGWQVQAFSRRATHEATPNELNDVQWHCLPSLTTKDEPNIPYWISLAPIWVLPDHFAMLQAHHARRIVVLSSTSVFTKVNSPDLAEQALVQRLINAESQLQVWAESQGVEWVILRPTLIYGRGRDKNLSEIARLIRRFGFFPLVGQGLGQRQPVHVSDVAAACASGLSAPVSNRDYNLSGAETLSYREMVNRVFTAMGRRPRLLVLPLAIFKMALLGLRLLPRYRLWTAAMADRMNHDLVFDHADAARDLGFKPRPFRLTKAEVTDF